MKKKCFFNLLSLIAIGSSVIIPGIALTSCSTNSYSDTSIPTFVDYEINWDENDLSKSTFNIRNSESEQKEIIHDSNGFIYADTDKTTIIAYRKELNLNIDSSKIFIPRNIEKIGYAYINNKLVGAFANEFSNNLIDDKNNIQEIEFETNSNLVGIFKNSFANLPLIKNIIIPDSVRLIDSFAFFNCLNLENIHFPRGLVKIGNSAFQNAFKSSSANIVIDLSYCYNLNEIDAFTFYLTNISDVKLPDSIKIIKESAFEDCLELTNINVPNGLVEIRDFAFRNCQKLIRFEIPKTLKHFGQKVFFKANGLKEIVFNSNILDDVYFELHAFAGIGANEATKIIFQDKNIFDFVNNIYTKKFLFGVSTTGNVVMYKTQIVYQSNPEIESIIPENPLDNKIFKFVDEAKTSIIGLTMLGQFCSKLTIPKSTRTIGMLLKPTMVNDFVQEIDFSNAIGLETINAFSFTNFKNHKVIDLSKNKKLTYLGQEAFRANTSVTNVYLPKSIKQINFGAFYESSSIQQIVFEPNTELEELGDSSFSDLINLEEIVNFPKITKISTSLFSNNKKYKFNFDLLDDLTEIGPLSFINNILLETVDLSRFNNLQSIGESAFSGCQLLKTLKFPNESKITKIESQTFYKCKNFDNVELPSSVEEISNLAFSECTNLTNITINENCNLIAANAFTNTNKINNITFNWKSIDPNLQLNQCFKSYSQLTGTNTLTINVKNNNIKQYLESQEGCMQLFGTNTLPNNINIVVQQN